MSKPSVLICCPGSWTHGLDSPERGEGRWSQNLARALGESGEYEVFACSGGLPTWGYGRPCPNVTLLPEAAVEHLLSEVDVYVDSSWWEHKPAKVKARVNLHLHFSLEERLCQQDFGFGPDHYLCYPFKEHEPNFQVERNRHRDRTFFLPTPLGVLREPVYPERHTLLWSTRPPTGGGADNPVAERVVRALGKLREKVNVDVVWLFAQQLRDVGWLKGEHRFGDTYIDSVAGHGVPYQQIETLFDEVVTCNLTVGAPANVPNASVAGVPSLLWGGGSPGGGAWGPAKAIAEEWGVLLEAYADEDQIAHCLFRLLASPTRYMGVAKALQALYKDCTTEVTLRQWKYIMRATGVEP